MKYSIIVYHYDREFIGSIETWYHVGTGMSDIIGLYSSHKGREGIKSRTTFYHTQTYGIKSGTIFHHTGTEDIKSTTGPHTQTEGIKSGTAHLRVSDLVCCSDVAELYKYGCDTSKKKKANVINPLKTNGRLLYLKAQPVPRCKHFSSRL